MGIMLLIYAALMILLSLTIIAALFPLGALGLIIALLIACAKALLVVLFFMHVKFESRATAVFAATSLLWIGIMLTLTLSDYVSRGWLPRSEEVGRPAEVIPPPSGIVRAQPEGQPIDQDDRPRRAALESR
jgi:cytochrome c oxidase subunit 4